MVINGPDAVLLKGKKIVVIDDVVSTGMTMRMADKLMENVGASVIAHVAVIRQGESALGGIDHLTYLHHLPIFTINPD